MWDLIRVSIRNVGRNKRRSMITIFTVFIGVVVITGIRGLLNGLQGEIREGLTRKVHGDVQVHRAGYQDALDANPYKFLFDLKEVTPKLPAGARFAPRLRVMGLLNHQGSQSTTPVLISGIDSSAEREVVPRFQEALVEGRALERGDGVRPTANAGGAKGTATFEADGLGEAMSLDEVEKKGAAAGGAGSSAANHALVATAEILVTPSLMRGFGAKLGDETVVLIQDRDGMQQALIAKIVGVVDFAMPGASARMAWMDYGTLRKRLGTGDQASELAVRLREGEAPENAQASLQSAVGPGLVVETWRELAGLLRDAMNLQNFTFRLVIAIVFSIVISAIVNTSLMTVMERTREIGTLMALGYRRKHILALFLIEFAVIGGTGGVLGVSFASLAMKVLATRGLVFKLPGQALATVLHPYVAADFVGFVFVLSVVAALAAGLFPAYRASRLKPVQALSAT